MNWYLDQRCAIQRMLDMRREAKEEHLAHLAQESPRRRVARRLRVWAAKLEAASKAPATEAADISGTLDGVGRVFPAT